MNQLGFYSSVSTSKDIREASKALSKAVSDFSEDNSMREDVYKALKEYRTTALGDGSFEKLDSES